MTIFTLTENLGIKTNELEEILVKFNQAMNNSIQCVYLYIYYLLLKQANYCNPIITSLSNKARCYEQLIDLGKQYLKNEAEFTHYSQKLSELKAKGNDVNKLYNVYI